MLYFVSESNYQPLQTKQCGKPSNKYLVDLLVIINIFCMVATENVVIPNRCSLFLMIRKSQKCRWDSQATCFRSTSLILEIRLEFRIKCSNVTLCFAGNDESKLSALG